MKLRELYDKSHKKTISVHLNKKEDIKSKEFLNSKKCICSKIHHKFLRLQNEETIEIKGRYLRKYGNLAQLENFRSDTNGTKPLSK